MGPGLSERHGQEASTSAAAFPHGWYALDAHSSETGPTKMWYPYASEALVHDPKAIKDPSRDVTELPRNCPNCGKLLTAAVRTVHCPCDAPWCFVTETYAACPACGSRPR